MQTNENNNEVPICFVLIGPSHYADDTHFIVTFDTKIEQIVTKGILILQDNPPRDDLLCEDEWIVELIHEADPRRKFTFKIMNDTIMNHSFRELEKHWEIHLMCLQVNVWQQEESGTLSFTDFSYTNRC